MLRALYCGQTGSYKKPLLVLGGKARYMASPVADGRMRSRMSPNLYGPDIFR